MQSHGRSSLQINGPPLSQGDNRATSPIPPNGNVMPATEKNLKGGDNDSDSNSDEDEVIGDAGKKDLMSMAEMKRKQTTSIVLMGVIGAEFGQELEPIRKKEEVSLYPQANDGKQVQEGFGIAQALARQTTQALSYLLLAPPSPGLPPYSALRRSAVDLIGRGFPVWEPHLEVSKVLLGLLELCAADADKLAPSMEYGLPLTPVADMCRTSRHALLLVATARPQVFITTLAREVARYNTLQQNAQTLNVNLSASVLARAKADMLRVLSKLFETRQLEVVNLMVEVMDIVLHCIDTGHLRAKTLQEVFPTICRFPMVAHCLQTRRIAVGAQNGQLALYELKGSKCQSIPAHVAGITACAFAHDGKFLATYSQSEARLSFWQTSSGMFGLGNTQTKCVKSFSTAPVPEIVRLNPLRTARLVWINARTIALLMPDGSESRFSV
ncbi:unnamed protein product [Notodromas monacha]|uniref:WD repeat-containing protein 7 n=1 Tax=Notodromas monacha TaxID=399045 RepID=A0A7R9BCC8_9CRUS|nr:unnamed protein product [Notodromas monacha]CAG0912268.1 unnamed protein product [Notodromas monacha]